MTVGIVTGSPNPNPACRLARPATTQPRSSKTGATGTPPARSPAQLEASPLAPASLRVCTLGEFAVWHGDRLLPPHLWRGDKASNLFIALLSAAGHRLSREQVIALLWPEAELASAANSLREVLCNLRRRLKGHDCAAASETYLCNQGAQWLALAEESIWIDADAFAEAAGTAAQGDDLAACQAALDLYHGEYLAGQATDHFPGQAALIRARRKTLRRLYIKVLAHAGDLCEADDPQRASDYFRRAAALNPVGEEHARRYMALLARMGELGAAHDIYAALTKALARQGLTPSRETIAAHGRLLTSGLGAAERAPTASPETGLRTVLAIGGTGSLPASVLAVARAHGGTALSSSDPAGPWLFAFAIPAAALEASWILAAPTSGSTIPRGLRLALHTRVLAHGEGARAGETALAPLLAAQAHAGQVLVSRATHAVAGPSLPAGSLLMPLDCYDLVPGQAPQVIYQLTRASSPLVFPPLKAPSHRPHNLPAALTPYLERPRLEARLELLLAPSNNQATRLLTLTGVGGGGKTRLALKLAHDLLPYFPGGAWLVELAAQTPDRDLIAAVGRALGLREERDRPFEEAIVAYLRARERPILLVLDNCEHLRAPCARLIATLLQAGPQVRILATSRERLGMQGERVEEAPPLTTPPAGSGDTRLGDITRAEAVQLFCARARDVAPDFSLTTEHAEPIAVVCRRLDGIPLAIELAAAQLAWRPLAAIAGDLEDFPTLLAGGNAGAPERHQTLRAALDWSYSLLDPQTRILFRRLSVFAGGCTLPAAQAVCAGSGVPPGDVARLLRTLVTASLVRSSKWRKHERYRLLEPVRQYGLEWLERDDRA
ncbi:MAG TPA: AAA family ATPase [Chloroflexota bacterium]|nr:AAA family ATPase [Chloroflexota bacterium]